MAAVFAINFLPVVFFYRNEKKSACIRKLAN